MNQVFVLGWLAVALAAASFALGYSVAPSGSEPTPDFCAGDAWPPPAPCIVPGWRLISPQGKVYRADLP